MHFDNAFERYRGFLKALVARFGFNRRSQDHSRAHNVRL